VLQSLTAILRFDNSLGYLNTTGLEAIDYRLVAPFELRKTFRT
jgi:hypothetical protein